MILYYQDSNFIAQIIVKKYNHVNVNLRNDWILMVARINRLTTKYCYFKTKYAIVPMPNLRHNTSKKINNLSTERIMVNEKIQR